jgi:hypothetical protein
MVDFSSLLNVKAEDIKAPPQVVPGDVILTVKGYKFVESGQKKTPGVEFDFTLDSYETVLTDDGEVPEGIVGKTISDTFWISQDAAKAETSRYMLKEFLEKCGIRGEGQTLNEMLADVAGQQVKASIRPEPNEKNPERPFQKIKSYSPM